MNLVHLAGEYFPRIDSHTLLEIKRVTFSDDFNRSIAVDVCVPVTAAGSSICTEDGGHHTPTSMRVCKPTNPSSLAEIIKHNIERPISAF